MARQCHPFQPPDCPHLFVPDGAIRFWHLFVYVMFSRKAELQALRRPDVLRERIQMV